MIQIKDVQDFLVAVKIYKGCQFLVHMSMQINDIIYNVCFKCQAVPALIMFIALAVHITGQWACQYVSAGPTSQSPYIL